MSCFTSAFAAPSKPSIVCLQSRIVGFQFCDERAEKRLRRRDESVLPFLANATVRAVAPSVRSVEPIISAKYDPAHIRSWVSVAMVLRSAHRTILRQWMRKLGSRSTQLEIGRCHMQKPFAYSPVSQKNHAWSLSMWELSILALVVAVMLFMISFAFVNPPSASDHAASERAAPSEFSTGMPLP
jgi:hypothetical protein